MFYKTLHYPIYTTKTTPYSKKKKKKKNYPNFLLKKILKRKLITRTKCVCRVMRLVYINENC